MVAVTPYTDSDAIRGALGVTDDELLDEMITKAGYDLQLESDLDQWLTDHEDLAAAAAATAETVTTLTGTLATQQGLLTASAVALGAAQAEVATTSAAQATAQSDYDAAPTDPVLQQALADAIAAADAAVVAAAAALIARDDAQAAVDATAVSLAEAKLADKSNKIIWRNLRLYAMWFCVCLAGSAILAIPKKVSNGKDAFERFDATTLAAVIANANQKREAYKDLLLTLTDAQPDVPVFSMGALSSPSYDPVTNEGA